MKKLLTLIIVGLLCLSTFSIFMPQVKAQATSNTSDPTSDLYYYMSGSPAPTWAVIDIVYAEISQVDSANIKLLIRANQAIPLTNQWQGYYWLLDTGIPAPPYWNPIDSNDINVAYSVNVGWGADGSLHIRLENVVSGTMIFDEDVRSHPEQYFSGDTCFITIPLSLIGNPTSIEWVANTCDGVADPSGRHDKAPNTGHATLTTFVILPPYPSGQVSGSQSTRNSVVAKGIWAATAYPSNGYSHTYASLEIGRLGVRTDRAQAESIFSGSWTAPLTGDFEITFVWNYNGKVYPPKSTGGISLGGGIIPFITICRWWFSADAHMEFGTSTIDQNVFRESWTIPPLGEHTFQGIASTVIGLHADAGTTYEWNWSISSSVRLSVVSMLPLRQDKFNATMWTDASLEKIDIKLNS